MQDAGKHLGRPPSWIYDNHKRLGIPAFKVGSRLGFRLSELDNWLEEQRTTRTDVRCQ